MTLCGRLGTRRIRIWHCPLVFEDAIADNPSANLDGKAPAMKRIDYLRLQGFLLTALVSLATSGSAQARGTPFTDLLLEQGAYGSGTALLPLEDPTRPTPPNGTFLFPTTPVDDVICGALLPVLGSDPIAQACELCNPFPLPSGLQLPASRQHELTRAAVLAFFNAYLRCRPLALAYLKHAFANENDEIEATYSAGFGHLVQCVRQ